jgi:membrane-associated phospholipid phosphatase
VSDLSDVFNNDGYPITELRITPNPDGLALHDITPAQLFAQLHILLAGQTVATVPEGNGHLDVFIRLTDPTHLSIEQLNQLPVMANGWVALNEVADVRMATGPNVIRHLNGLRAVEILATPTAPLGQVISASRQALATLSLPAGYEVKFGGLYPQLERAAINVGVAAVVALALMLGIRCRRHKDSRRVANTSLSVTRFPYGCRLRILVVLAWLVWQRRLRSAAYWISAVLFAQLFVVTLKFFMRRARPSSMYEGLQGFSFPSNHATLSVVTYGFLAFFVARAWGNVARRRIATATALFILLISFSRLYLGAHWFSDVLAGLSFGVAWIAIAAVLHHLGDENQRDASSLGIASFVTFVISAVVHIIMQHGVDLSLYAPR